MSEISDVLEGRARWALMEGNCAHIVSRLPAESIDALVTDPPAGIGFMGKAWDGDKGGREQWVAWLATVMKEALRVLKPGAHGLVWALPRTSHWTATALEDAGLEVRDRVAHLFGTGFPKSHNGEWGGTALKPAMEDWWLVRKPLEGTVAANVAKWGTGAINVDGCRIGTGKRVPGGLSRTPGASWGQASLRKETGEESGHNPNVGRWPANLTLDEEAAALLDAQSGTLKSGARKAGKKQDEHGAGVFNGHGGVAPCVASEGGASRFFYVAKTSTAERNAAGQNKHPTVKPLALMRWLCRLITPPGGVVLDPFTGSGSTGCADLQEGLRFVGMEREEAYAGIARARLEHAAKSPDQADMFNTGGSK